MPNKNQILKKLSKSLPEGSVFLLSEDDKSVNVIPTGISTLDFSLGIGGFARGWQTMLYGPSSSGKSALVLQTIGSYQKEHPDSFCCVVDLENSMTADWAIKFGVDPERLIILKPTCIEEMVTMTMQAIENAVFDVIMVDSLGAGLLQTEIDNDKSRVAGSSGAITRLVKAINSSFVTLERQKKILRDKGDDDTSLIEPAVVLINQVRVDMNSMYGGNTYPGGKALAHMCGQIIQLRTSKASGDKIEGTVDGNKLRVGWMCSATIEKNKLSVPGKSAGYTFVFKECPEHEFGIDNARSTADLALALGIAKVEGKTIYFNRNGEEDKIVGRNNFIKLVKKDEELMNSLSEEISRVMSDNLKDPDVIENYNTNPDETL